MDRFTMLSFRLRFTRDFPFVVSLQPIEARSILAHRPPVEDNW